MADQAPTPNILDIEVLIQPLQKVIEVEPGANLLDALRNAQVPMSYSCMAGRCGTCRCRGKFDVRDGKPSCAPVTEALRSYPVKVDGQRVYLQID